MPTNAAATAALDSQEVKRRRRRESHNLVERRRRDNINERIQDLSCLVPQHRLEDDRVRKHLMTPQLNGSGSPQMDEGEAGGAGRSTNNATSLLAGGSGRRAMSGSMSIGFPAEEKEKGPNKGDILNSAVSWTRDLMWALNLKLQQEAELAQLISELGGNWPFEVSEEEKRMRTELLEALDRGGHEDFGGYSRAPGSGLRVPKHTTLTGEPLPFPGNEDLSPKDDMEMG